jgi:hypothetical protein
LTAFPCARRIYPMLVWAAFGRLRQSAVSDREIPSWYALLLLEEALTGKATSPSFETCRKQDK